MSAGQRLLSVRRTTSFQSLMRKPMSALRPFAGPFAGEQALQIVRRAAHVRDVQVGRLLETDVDEGGLHPGQHAFDAALVDVAGDPALLLALDVELAEQTVLDQGNAGLGTVCVNHQKAIGHPRLWKKFDEPTWETDANVRVLRYQRLRRIWVDITEIPYFQRDPRLKRQGNFVGMSLAEHLGR